jgi:hypothetical protein
MKANKKQYTFPDRLKNTMATSKAEMATVEGFKALLRHLIRAVILVKQQWGLLILRLVTKHQEFLVDI